MNNVMKREFKELTVMLVLEEMLTHKIYPQAQKGKILLLDLPFIDYLQTGGSHTA
jgi:hypothetical protein